MSLQTVSKFSNLRNHDGICWICPACDSGHRAKFFHGKVYPLPVSQWCGHTRFETGEDYVIVRIKAEDDRYQHDGGDPDVLQRLHDEFDTDPSYNDPADDTDWYGVSLPVMDLWFCTSGSGWAWGIKVVNKTGGKPAPTLTAAIDAAKDVAREMLESDLEQMGDHS